MCRNAKMTRDTSFENWETVLCDPKMWMPARQQPWTNSCQGSKSGKYKMISMWGSNGRANVSMSYSLSLISNYPVMMLVCENALKMWLLSQFHEFKCKFLRNQDGYGCVRKCVRKPRCHTFWWKYFHGHRIFSDWPTNENMTYVNIGKIGKKHKI